MEEEIKNRIEDLELKEKDYYIDSKFRDEARERRERLEQLYDDMFGY